MKIIIIGAGKVGFTLAEHLSQENHDVTIIDKRETAIRHASDSLDVMCLKGSGASPGVLKQAGVAGADLVLSATSLDEVNMLCSLVAKQLGAKYTIARVRDVEYTADLSDFQRDLDIDMVINPEYSTAIEISHLLRFPAATNIDTFFRGKAELLGMTVREGDFIIGSPLADLSRRLQNLPFLFCGAERDGKVIIPKGSFTAQAGDKLYLIGTPNGIERYFLMLKRQLTKVQSVFIVGGSRIAHYLAHMLQGMHMSVTIVDNQEARCRLLSETLPQALILHGDGTDQELLATEHFSRNDAFISLTGRDEDNLLISLYAKQQGLKKVIAKCSRDTYVSIVRSAGLESIVSPKMVAVGRILQMVRSYENKAGGIMLSLYRFADDRAEAAEFEVSASAMHLGKPLKDLPLRPRVLIAAIFHEGEVIIPNGNHVIREGDRVIVVSYNQSIEDFNDIYELHMLSKG